MTRPRGYINWKPQCKAAKIVGQVLEILFQNADFLPVLMDDTGIIYSKVACSKYPEITQGIIDQGQPGKSIYAIAGSIIPRSSFLMVKSARYLGSMENE